MEQDDKEGIFSPLIGHDGAKAILRSALRRGDIHLLLSGPPASGKTVALLAIEDAIDGAEYVDARGFTERKLRDTLAQNPPALLIDEFDNMKPDAFKALNIALEQGRVTKQATGDSYDEEIDTQVLVACNYPDELPSDVADRFVQVDFDPYTYEEYLDVCEVLLPRQVEWVAEVDDSGSVSREIADIVWTEADSRSPRTAREAARLADASERVPAIVQAMNNAKADVDSEPITVEDLPHNEWGDDENTSQRPTSLDEVRKRMTDSDEIGSLSVKEIEAMLGNDGGGADAADSKQDHATDDIPDPSTPADINDTQDRGPNLDVDIGCNSGMEYLQYMIKSGNRVIPNSFEQSGVGIIYPEQFTDEILALVDQWKLDPEAPDVLPQTSSTIKKEFGEDVADDLREVQFVLDDVQNVRSTGYDIPQIVDALDDEPFIISKTATVQWEPEL